MKATKAELATEVTELRRVGAQMANVCFNLSQSPHMHVDDKKIMAQLVRDWDAVKRTNQ